MLCAIIIEKGLEGICYAWKENENPMCCIWHIVVCCSLCILLSWGRLSENMAKSDMRFW